MLKTVTQVHITIAPCMHDSIGLNMSYIGHRRLTVRDRSLRIKYTIGNSLAIFPVSILYRKFYENNEGVGGWGCGTEGRGCIVRYKRKPTYVNAC